MPRWSNPSATPEERPTWHHRRLLWDALVEHNILRPLNHIENVQSRHLYAPRLHRRKAPILSRVDFARLISAWQTSAVHTYPNGLRQTRLQ
jgi:hypothetical protein